VIASAILWGLALAAVPLMVWAYGNSELVAPGLLMTLAVPLFLFQAPLAVFYRRMDFARQRLLEALGPVVAFAVTMALAVTGSGYWSLIVGTLVGTAATTVATVALTPYRFALRYDRDTMRAYVRFSLPLFAGSLSAIVIGQGSLLLGQHLLGLAAVGAIVLASTVAQWTERADEIVTATLYPAICAVRDRVDLLFESFVKSNRLALMWGIPVGVGIALFAADLASFVIGQRWRPAVGVIQVFALMAAANHIGFNWHAFFRARGDTRPVAIWALVTGLVFAVAVPPLIVADGLAGYAIGMAAMTAASLVVRAWFLVKIFPGFSMLGHAARAIAPTVPAAAVVLLARAVETGARSPVSFVAELAAYCAVTLAVTLLAERSLLREVTAYLRRARATPRVAT
jgi:O-antigen/teichoic acid export membrane protein